MRAIHPERRDIYDLDADLTMPELADVSPAITCVIEEDVLKLTSVYYDTAELDLLRNDITLRRRIGSIDAGWQLKLPGPDARLELALPADGTTIPKQLRDILLAARHGRRLQQVATVEISRNVQRQLAADGRVLATVSEDEAHATTTLAPDGDIDWREVEIELGEVGDEALLAAIKSRLMRAGAHPSVVRSKLQRVLAGTEPAAQAQLPHWDGSAGSAMTRHLNTQCRNLIAADALHRTGQKQVFTLAHTIRRIQSALAVYPELFDQDQADAVAVDLRWLSNLLVPVADNDALQDRLLAEIDALPPELVIGEVGGHIRAQIAARQQRPRAELDRALRSRRYLALIDTLAGWSSAPPLTDEATNGPAVLSLSVERAHREVASQLHQLAHSNAIGDALPRCQQAADRALDATELALSHLGKRNVKGRLHHYCDLHDLITEHEQAVASAQLLLELGTAKEDTLQNRFSYGLLFSLEEVLAREVQLKLLHAKLSE